jgi:hypothetical protein
MDYKKIKMVRLLKKIKIMPTRAPSGILFDWEIRKYYFFLFFYLLVFVIRLFCWFNIWLMRINIIKKINNGDNFRNYHRLFNIRLKHGI